MSVPSNIAEGCERNSAPDFKRFLNMALGSNAELRTQLSIAARINLVPAGDAMVAENKDISAMLHGLRKCIPS